MNEPIPNLTIEQALKLNSRPYGELPYDIQIQVTSTLSAYQMSQSRDNKEEKK